MKSNRILAQFARRTWSSVGWESSTQLAFVDAAQSIGALQGNFARWLVEHTAKNDDDIDLSKVRMAKFPFMGHGLAAACPLSAGEVVLEIPHSLWFPLSARYAQQVAELKVPQFVSHLKQVQEHLSCWGVDTGPKLDQHVLLGLHILFEFAEDNSFLQPYLQMLPLRFETPIFWDARRRQELQGTKAAKATEDFESFTRAVHQSVLRGGGISYPLFVWSLSVILSRAVSGKHGSLYPYTLVPLFDLLNHSPRPTCFHNFDPHRQVFVVKTLQDHNPGDQLFISYGDASNEKLLRLYGFTSPNLMHEVCELSPRWPEVDEDDPMHTTKLLLLRECVLGYDGPISISLFKKKSDLADMMQRIRVLQLKPEDLEPGHCLQGMNPSPEDLDFFQPVSSRNEASSALALSNMIQERLNSYATSLEEDQNMIMQATVNPEKLPAWKLCALDCRMGEKLVLQQVLKDVKIIHSYWTEQLHK